MRNVVSTKLALVVVCGAFGSAGCSPTAVHSLGSDAGSESAALASIAHVDPVQDQAGTAFALVNGEIPETVRGEVHAVFRGGVVRLEARDRHLDLELATIDGAAVPRASSSAVAANRIAWSRGSVTEWYVHGPKGLEQGFTFSRPASDRAHLSIESSVSGLHAVERGADVVELLDANDAVAFVVHSAASFDADGRKLPTHLRTSEKGILLDVDVSAARYPIVVDPVYAAVTTVKPSPTVFLFGKSVAASGSSVILGGTQDNYAGFPRVYTRTGSTFTLQQILPGIVAGDRGRGYSVAIDGDFAAVGAPCDKGFMTYKRTGSTWAQVGSINVMKSGTVTWAVCDEDYPATVLSAQGGLLAVGTTTITPSDFHDMLHVYSYDASGAVTDLSGGTGPLRMATGRHVAVAAPFVFSADEAGKLRVLRKGAGATWDEAFVTTPDNFDLETSLAVKGTLLAAGIPSHAVESVTVAGEVVLYDFNPAATTASSALTFKTRLVSPTPTANQQFGSSVAISDSGKVVVGVPSEAAGLKGGAGGVYVFEGSGTTWTSTHVQSPAAVVGGAYGTSVAAGQGIAIGAMGENAAYLHLQAGGEKCSAAIDCGSGNCVEGVCCDTACGGSCQSCLATRKGSGADGTCGAVPVGTDPKSACSGGYCTASGCTAKAAAGAACTAAYQCASGFCTEGVCCDKVCSGGCEACTAAKKGSGADGKCEPVAAGTNPKSACTAAAGYPYNCLGDGKCDGVGACRVYAPPATPCSATGKPTCSDGTSTGKLCNGSGLCADSSIKCTPYACNAAGDGCNTACASDADCDKKALCGSTKTCIAKKDNGASCSVANECVSGNCVDGVCCNGACAGQCAACDVPGQEGTCTPISGKPRATRAPCDGSGTTCEGTCGGTNPLACVYPGAETSCGGTCSGDRSFTASVCNSKGGCVSAMTSDCGGSLRCDAAKGTCKASCTGDADCVSGFVCDTASRACKPATGASCVEGNTASMPPSGGSAVSCSPYLCEVPSGLCFQACNDSGQCADGFICDAPSKTCVPPTGETADSGGCSLTARNTASSSAAWLGLAALVYTLRRRRSVTGRTRGLC